MQTTELTGDEERRFNKALAGLIKEVEQAE